MKRRWTGWCSVEEHAFDFTQENEPTLCPNGHPLTDVGYRGGAKAGVRPFFMLEDDNGDVWKFTVNPGGILKGVKV